MSHPFENIFQKAIEKSRGDDNRVLAEAEKLRESGYSANEIYSVLKSMKIGLINQADEDIVAEALESFSQYVDTGSNEEEEITDPD